MSLSPPPPLSQPRDAVSQPMYIIRCILECKAMTCIETCYKDTYSEDDCDSNKHDDTLLEGLDNQSIRTSLKYNSVIL